MAEVSADEASGGFFTSKSAAGNSTLTTTRSTTGDDERNMSEAAFAHWKTELTNRIVADEEKRAKEERKAFKEKQDALFWQRKKQLHQKTSDDLAAAKGSIESIRQKNQEQAAAYKKELELMKQLRESQREDWATFGHELTVEFAQEHCERRKQRILETAEEKARKGLEVRREEKRLEKQLASQRQETLEASRQHVQMLKQEKIGKTDESMAFALKSRQDAVETVKKTERKWKDTATRERQEFLGHAHENREKAHNTVESMRTSRKALIGSRSSAVREERQRKASDAAIIAERKAAMDKLKQNVHDAVFSQRKVGSERQETVRTIMRSKTPKKKAVKAGLVASSARAPSPYRMSVPLS